MDDRLHRQLQFLLELDKLKTIFRRNYLADGTRVENDAEHSWHFALAACLLCEHAAVPVDAAKVMRMGLIHDVVEIDAGDTFVYDTVARATQEEREARAADRLFGLLPEDQAREYLGLWREFESNQTPESRFARAIDRMLPVLLNHASHGKAWREHGVTREKIFSVNQERITLGSPALWEAVRARVEEAEREGYTAPAVASEE